MIKDIDFKKPQELAMAVVKTDDNDDSSIWKVYLLNLKEQPIESVLVHSTGYGKANEKKVKTSALRQFFEQIEGRSFVEVEILTNELIGINNQFWVSFSFGGYLYDKKYVFLAETIREEHFTDIPLLNTKGILIK